jgi:RNA processing factor Prp31
MNLKEVAHVLQRVEELPLNEIGIKSPIRKRMRYLYNVSFTFQWAVDDVSDEVIFVLSKNNFNSLEHYMGFEYVRSHITMKIEIDDEILVAYEACDRVNTFVNMLAEEVEE